MNGTILPGSKTLTGSPLDEDADALADDQHGGARHDHRTRHDRHRLQPGPPSRVVGVPAAGISIRAENEKGAVVISRGIVCNNMCGTKLQTLTYDLIYLAAITES